MAAPRQSMHRTFSGSIHRNPDNSPWPKGPCSFRNLDSGARAPTCGCRRFWLNVAGNAVGHEGERAWCFCGHHACYHEAQSLSGANGLATEAVDDGQAQIATEDFMTHSRRQSDFVSRAIADPIFNSSTVEDPSPPAKADTGLGIENVAQSHTQSINTRLWQALNGFARHQEDLPSTAVPSVADEARTSPMHVGQDQLQQHCSMGPPINIPNCQPLDIRVDEYSATEVATPSVAGTPDFRAAGLANVVYTSPPRQTSPRLDRRPHTSHLPITSTGSPRPAIRGESRVTPGLIPSLSIQEMRNTIQDYGRRLNVLENMSFNQMPHDDIHEKFELADGRLLDLEHWRAEQESKAEHESTPSPRLERSSSAKRRRMLPPARSLASDGSFDSNAAARAETMVLATLAANAETGPRIDSLEARVEDLERAALPSFARPWHVQVILLPFGRQLPGVWFSSTESTEQLIRSTQQSEEWNGAPPAVTSSFMSSDGAWTTDSIRAWANETHDEWLSPKACGPTGAVFQRLKSRGFVREVTLTTPDAHSILKTISGAFEGILGIDPSDVSDNAEKFHGLREPLIPLRKVRKSTRLRFLTRSEMVTSAIWTAGFLDASVFMRLGSGHRRLYVTTPDAYLQDSGNQWTWKMIKTLPMHEVDDEEQAAQLRGDLIEACWTYHERLDRVSSLHSSFATHENSHWGDENAEPNQSMEAEVSQQSAILKPVHIRANSLPSSSSADVLMLDTSTVPDRRVTSFAAVGPIQQLARPSRPLDYPSKRRRVSNSPELERRGVNFTPATSHRFSREPPSPGITSSGGVQSGAGAPSNSQATSSNPHFRHKRGTTPFAYATPHSHLESAGCVGDEDGDTEVNTAPSEREWEGVQEGPAAMLRGNRGIRAMTKRGLGIMEEHTYIDDENVDEDEDDDDEDDEEEDEDEEEDDEEEGDDIEDDSSEELLQIKRRLI